MYRASPLRGRSLLDGRKVLLIDVKQATRDLAGEVLNIPSKSIHAEVKGRLLIIPQNRGKGE